MGLSCLDQLTVDEALCGTDGTADLHRLGANAVVAVSLASLKAAAAHNRQSLYRYIAGPGSLQLPRPMVNIISGGAHADGLIDLQDVLAVPLSATTFAGALEQAWRVRRGTAAAMHAQKLETALVADEGGLAAPMTGNEKAIALVTEGISRAGLEPGVDVGIAIDVAATELFDGDNYRFGREERSLSSADLTGEVAQWCSRYPIVSVEDALNEDDWSGWQALTTSLGRNVQLVGDDLFATNTSRLHRGVAMGAANAVLIKVNQAGTVSRAMAVARTAAECEYAAVLSARSGDTEESWLADLAVGWGIGQIKVGSTTRSERTAKWNRLLEIEAVGRDAVTLAPPRRLTPVVNGA